MAEVIDFSSRAVMAKRQESGFRAFEDSGRAEERLFFVFRDQENYLILRYDDLESIGPGPGVEANRAVLLRFGGTVPREVRIEGTRLLDLVSLLRWQRVAFVEESPEGCAGGGDAVASINCISVRNMKQ
jgi:hypothetical protein